MKEKVMENLLEVLNVERDVPMFPERVGAEIDGMTVAPVVTWHVFVLKPKWKLSLIPRSVE